MPEPTPPTGRTTDRHPIEALAAVNCQHTRHHAMCLPCAADAIRPKILRLLAERDQLREQLAEASDALRGVAKAALTVAPTLRKPYRDAPNTSPWKQFMEQPARRAYDLGVRLRHHAKEATDAH